VYKKKRKKNWKESKKWVRKKPVTRAIIFKVCWLVRIKRGMRGKIVGKNLEEGGAVEK